MADQFQVGGKGQKQLKQFNKKAPKAFQRTSAGVLNSMAFADLEQIPKTMNSLMEIRTLSMIRRGTRVQMASKSDTIDKQQSKSGSIKTTRHDGWEAVEAGDSVRITQFTDAGRGGSNTAVAKKAAKAGQNVTDESDIKTKGSKTTASYLQAIKRDKARRRKTFYLGKAFKGMPRGIYKFIGGSIKKGVLIAARILRLSTPADKVNVSGNGWKRITTKVAVTERKIRAWWVSNADRELKKIINKK